MPSDYLQSGILTGPLCTRMASNYLSSIWDLNSTFLEKEYMVPFMTSNYLTEDFIKTISLPKFYDHWDCVVEKVFSLVNIKQY